MSDLVSPRFEPVDLGFSTADGESPVFHFDGADLHVRFTDWREQPVGFVAVNALHFAWSEELFEPGIRDDTTYEVFDSPLVASFREISLVRPEAPLRHFKFCFNARGVLDVACERISVL
jgi:hypothetical protein